MVNSEIMEFSLYDFMCIFDWEFFVELVLVYKCEEFYYIMVIRFSIKYINKVNSMLFLFLKVLYCIFSKCVYGKVAFGMVSS